MCATVISCCDAAPVFEIPEHVFDGEILPAYYPRRVMRADDRLWHADSSFNPMPAKWSMLSGRIAQPVGGDTEFADVRAVYDALSEDM